MSATLPPLEVRPKTSRTLSIDHLRAFLILLVVAHHAVLAYVSFAPPPDAGWSTPPMLWRAFPIVDTVRASGLDILVVFNDVVLMALLFFLAGLFTWRSLIKKGALGFLRGRTLRLGLPFAVCALALAPLAYYPAYLQRGGEPGLGSYARAWLDLPVWPSGPAWFLWVLLAFSAVAAASYRLAPAWAEKLGERLGPLGARPGVFFALLALASALAYVPAASFIDPSAWTEYGPFAFQTTRILHYALYFVLGIALGTYGISSGLLSPQGRLARRWWLWQGWATVFLIALIVCLVAINVQIANGSLHPALPLVSSLVFTLSCAASSLMLLALFVRYGHWAGSLWRSLDRSAYGIYVVHYVFVNWLQLTLLDFPGPAIVKALAVFAAAALLSWFTAILLRRIPKVAAVI
ncbi:MAG TPA: acyltransferase [Acidobacteriota bacterium]|nr:acyltransferase [Acidobacteriota bacterium]